MYDLLASVRRHRGRQTLEPGGVADQLGMPKRLVGPCTPLQPLNGGDRPIEHLRPGLRAGHALDVKDQLGLILLVGQEDNRVEIPRGVAVHRREVREAIVSRNEDPDPERAAGRGYRS